MSEVSVNIRGRDDGLGSMIDNLRDKVNSLNKDVGNLDNFDSLTKTEKRVEVENANRRAFEGERERIQREYSDARRMNEEDMREAEQQYKAGQLSRPKFRRHQRNFEASQEQLSPEAEENEIKELEKESNNTLKLILKQLVYQEKIERERKQRDGGEFVEGSIGDFLNQNRQLRARQRETTDESELRILQSEIDANNAKILALRDTGAEEPSDGRSDGRMGAGFNQGVMSAARGDLTGTVMGGAQMMGGMGNLAKGFTIAGLVAMVIKEFTGHGEKIQEAIGETSSMRGGRGSAGAYNEQLQKIISSRDILGNLGLSGDEFAGLVNQKTSASSVAGNDVVGRTLDDFAFKKGFGADVGMFSEFERFTENQDTATSIGLDVLNVLTSIEESSLKENDLSTLAEKLNSQQAIMQFQMNKRNVADTDSALRILSAFESIGLSDKGAGGAGFLSQTVQGLGEGGGDNAMLLKYEAAKRAYPHLANDPAALRRFVRFNSDDPEYLKQFGNFAGQISGGSQMAMDDIIYTMFNPESEKDMDIYSDWFGGKTDFDSKISGEGIDKTRKSSLSKSQMYEDAQTSVGQITTMMSDFSNVMQELLINVKDFTKKPIDVNVKNQPKTTNTTRTGR